jgi:DNA-binding response OmpR family regulator
MCEQTLKKRVLLVIGDDEISRLLVEYLSGMAGFDVVRVLSVSDAVSKISGQDFFMVFLDWELIDDDIDRIFETKDVNGKDTFVVLLVDESTSFNFNYPVGAFFLKPFTVKDLNSVLLKVLNDD